MNGVNTKTNYTFYDNVSYMKQFMTTMKIENGASIKSRMWEGIMPIKTLRAWWKTYTFQIQNPVQNCS